MIYVNAAKGFRPGGLVPIVPPGDAGHRNRDCVAALRIQADPTLTIADTRSFKSDSLWELRGTGHQDGLVRSSPGPSMPPPSALSGATSSRKSCSAAASSSSPMPAARRARAARWKLHARPTEPWSFRPARSYQNAKITEGGASRRRSRWARPSIRCARLDRQRLGGRAPRSWRRRTGNWSAAPTGPMSAEVSAATMIRAILGNSAAYRLCSTLAFAFQQRQVRDGLRRQEPGR